MYAEGLKVNEAPPPDTATGEPTLVPSILNCTDPPPGSGETVAVKVPDVAFAQMVVRGLTVVVVEAVISDRANSPMEVSPLDEYSGDVNDVVSAVVVLGLYRSI